MGLGGMTGMTHLKQGVAAAACVALLALGAPAGAQDSASGFSSAQTEVIGTIVREYLLANPEVVMEALQLLEERQRLAEAEQQKQALTSQRTALMDDPHAPVMGNPDGDVVIVEFFDYQCGYCKRMFGPLLETAERDGGVKLVMKEFPILGPTSVIAARAALASRKQNKYAEYHTALMELRGQLTEDAIFSVAEDVGLDVDQLKNDMEAPEIAEALRANYELSEALNIRGTPAFVVGDELVPGAIGVETLQELIAQSRANSS